MAEVHKRQQHFLIRPQHPLPASTYSTLPIRTGCAYLIATPEHLRRHFGKQGRQCLAFLRKNRVTKHIPPIRTRTPDQASLWIILQQHITEMQYVKIVFCISLYSPIALVRTSAYLKLISILRQFGYLKAIGALLTHAFSPRPIERRPGTLRNVLPNVLPLSGWFSKHSACRLIYSYGGRWATLTTWYRLLQNTSTRVYPRWRSLSLSFHLPRSN